MAKSTPTQPRPKPKPRQKPEQLLDEAGVKFQASRWRGALDMCNEAFEDWEYHAEALKMTPCRGWCDTAAVDGVHLFFNPEFSSTLTDQELAFIAVHEVGHIGQGHLWRAPKHILEEKNLLKRGRLFKKWNYAADFALHQFLYPLTQEEEYQDFKMPDDALYDPKYEGMAAETIFDLLDDNFDGGPGMDKHIFIGKIGADGSMPAGAVDMGNGSWVMVLDGDGNPIKPDPNDPNNPFPKGMTEDEFKEQCKQLAEELETTQQHGSGHGNTQRGLATPPDPRESNEDWYTELIDFMLKTARCDFSYSRPNYPYLINSGLLVPGLKSELLEGIIAIDTSGSIDDKIYRGFANHVESVRGQITEHNLTLLFCDAKVASVQQVMSGTQIDWTCYGGGGTDFRPVFDWVELNNASPAFLIYFTDSYGTFPEVEPSYPVLWCVWGYPQKTSRRPGYQNIATPWGREIHITGKRR